MALALVAATLLVLQSLLSTWAFASPQQPMLDAFGNPLCITSGHAPDPAGGHSRLLDCCTLGCAGNSHAYAPPTDENIAIVHPVVAGDHAHVAGRSISIAPAEYTPGSPRAPPLTT